MDASVANALAQLTRNCVELFERVEADRSDSEAKQRLAALETRLEESLSSIYDNFAAVLAARYATEGWTTDPEVPGYVVHSVDGEEVRAPWYLLPDLPQGSTMRSFLALAQRLRSSPGSAICLSGSGASHEAFQRVSDLDFCEYLPSTRPRMLEALEHAVSLDGDLCLHRFWLAASETSAKMELRRPWDPSPQRDEGAVAAAAAARFGKYDFIGVSSAEGVVEITNLVLGDGMEHLSFAAQELPVGTWVPRRLTRPRELGRYVSFLEAQIRDLLRKSESEAGRSWQHVVKACKRAISWLRLLFREDEVDELLDLVAQGRLALRAALVARIDLWERTRASGDEVLAPFVERLVETLQELAAELGEDVAPPAAAAVDAWVERLRTQAEPAAGQVAELRKKLQRTVAVQLH